MPISLVCVDVGGREREKCSPPILKQGKYACSSHTNAFQQPFQHETGKKENKEHNPLSTKINNCQCDITNINTSNICQLTGNSNSSFFKKESYIRSFYQSNSAHI